MNVLPKHLICFAFVTVLLAVGCTGVEQSAQSEVGGDLETTAVDSTDTAGSLYTVDHYDPQRDGIEDLGTTIFKARAEKKKILLVIGGDW